MLVRMIRYVHVPSVGTPVLKWIIHDMVFSKTVVVLGESNF